MNVFSIELHLWCWQNSGGDNPCWPKTLLCVLTLLTSVIVSGNRGASCLGCFRMSVPWAITWLCECYTPYEICFHGQGDFSLMRRVSSLYRHMIYQRYFPVRVWLSTPNHFTLNIRGSLEELLFCVFMQSGKKYSRILRKEMALAAYCLVTSLYLDHLHQKQKQIFVGSVSNIPSLKSQEADPRAC